MPFYQFNPFTGGIKNSTHFQPLYPLAPVPLQKVDPPTMFYDTINTKPVKISPQGSQAYSTVDKKLLATMKKYQANLEKPVYLLGGHKDKLLFGATLALLGVTSVMAIDVIRHFMKTK